jgi:lysozyme family protein
MNSNFTTSFGLVLRHEGGWSDNPNDKGGATMKGVTLATFSDYLGRKATKTELRNISDVQLQEIYRLGYWVKAGCDKQPKGVDYALYDYAVNSGVGRARKAFDTITVRSAQEEIIALCDKRMSFLRGLSSWQYFSKGWTRRVAEVKRDALRMAGAGGDLFLEIEKHEKKRSNSTAGTIAVGGGGAGAVYDQAASLPLTWGLPLGLLILTGIAFIAWQVIRQNEIVKTLKESSNA